MPDEPLNIVIYTTARELYDANLGYIAFQEDDVQPMGVTFQEYNFPRYRKPTVIINYSNGEISINVVISILALIDNKQ